MSEHPRPKKEHTTSVAYPALKAVVGKLNLWKREGVRKMSGMKAMSSRIPYPINSFLIDCSDPETYVFAVSRGDWETLWFQFNNHTVYVSKTRCALELAEDSFPTPFPNRNKTLQVLASIYLNTPSGYYENASITNLSAWILDMRFTFNVLNVFPGSQGDPEYGPLRLFLNQVDNAQEVFLKAESLEQMSILTHPFFERPKCTIYTDVFDLERWSLLNATGSTIIPQYYFEEDTIYYDSFMNLAQRFVETRNVGFECTIYLSKYHTFEVIEDILANGVGWQFKPQNDTLAAVYSHYQKEIILTYMIPNLLHMKVNSISPRSQFSPINAGELLRINDSILFGSCEHRASMKLDYPWEPCIPYEFKQLVVNFRTFVIVAKIGRQPKSVMRLNSKEEVRNKLQYFTRNRNTRIKNLTIRGTDNDLGDPQYRHMISATNIRLFYEGVHSEEFFNVFDLFEMITGLKDFIVSSRESVQNCNFVGQAIKFRVLNKK